MLILDGAFAMSLLILAYSIFVFAYSIFILAHSIFEKSKVNGVKNEYFILDVPFHP